MRKKTIELIARCKEHGEPKFAPVDLRIITYLREYYGTSHYFSYSEITKELRRAVLDYIETCDDPKREFRRYLNCREYLFDNEYKPEHDILIFFISQIHVQDENANFINGFYDMPIWHGR